MVCRKGVFHLENLVWVLADSQHVAFVCRDCVVGFEMGVVNQTIASFCSKPFGFEMFTHLAQTMPA